MNSKLIYKNLQVGGKGKRAKFSTDKRLDRICACSRSGFRRFSWGFDFEFSKFL